VKWFIKIGLSIFGSGIALLVVTLISVICLVDPNHYKEQIVHYLNQVSGRNFIIAGDIRFTCYPWLGLNLGQLQVSNAPGFTEPTFAQVDQAQFQVKLLPLLTKQFEVGQILLAGLQLTLTRQADGHTNWEDLFVWSTSSESSAPTDWLNQLKINGLQITQGKLSWEDHQTQSRYVFTDFNLNTFAIIPDQPIDLQIHSALAVTGKTTLQGQVELTTQLNINLTKQLYQLTPLQLVTTLAGEQLPLGQHRLSLHTNIALDLVQPTLVLSALKLTGLETTLNGALQVNQLFTSPHLVGQIKLRKFQQLSWLLSQWTELKLPVKNILKNVNLATQFEVSFEQIQLKNFALQIDKHQLHASQLQIDFNHQKFTAPALALRLFGVDLLGQITVHQLLTSPMVIGQITATQFNLHQLWQQLQQSPLELSGVSWLNMPWLSGTTIALATQFQLNPVSDIQFNELELQIDDNRLQVQQLNLNWQQATLVTDAVSLNAWGISLTAKVQIAQLFSQPVIQGQLALLPFNPRTVLERLQAIKIGLPAISLPNNKILPLQTATLTTQFHWQNQQLDLSKVQLQVDDNYLKTGHLQVDLAQETLAASNFSLQAGKIKLTGKTQIQQLLTQPQATAAITIAPFNLLAFVKRFGKNLPPLPKLFTLNQASLTTQLTITPSTITLNNLHFTVDDNQLTAQQAQFDWRQSTLKIEQFDLQVLTVSTQGKLEITQLLTQPTLQGNLKLTSWNLRQLLSRLELPLPPTADPTVLNRLAIEMTLQGNLAQINLNPIKINLDDSQLLGNLKIKRFNPLALNFHFDVNDINIDRYFAPQPATPTSSPLSQPIQLPLNFLRTLNLNGSLKIGHLQAKQLIITDLELAVVTQPGYFQLIPQAISP
jgi:AsmA protein